MDEKTPATIKSARRVLEVLELFAERRGPATVSAVAEALDYPLSSTSVLLRSLERLGYLQHDAATREFRPTLRVMLLGTWMHDDLFGQGSLLSSMNTLRLRTGQTVMVGLRQGVHVRFILSLPSLRANGLKFPVGVTRPVCQSAVGKMLLTREADRDVQRIARAANAQAEPEYRVDVPVLLDEVRLTRLRGWAETRNYPRTGFATLAVLLPELPGQPPMAVTLGMRLETLQARADRLRQALQEAAERLAV